MPRLSLSPMGEGQHQDAGAKFTTWRPTPHLTSYRNQSPRTAADHHIVGY